MRCPFCHSDNDRVVDSRAASNGAVIRRRRECIQCHRRFTTYERVEETPLKVVKKDGVRQDFDRNKLFSGIRKACWKRDHVTEEQLEKLVSDIEKTLYDRGESEVSSRELGEMVIERLRAIDDVAFVRYASVYRRFKDVGDFVAQIDSMRKPADGSVGEAAAGQVATPAAPGVLSDSAANDLESSGSESATVT